MENNIHLNADPRVTAKYIWRSKYSMKLEITYPYRDWTASVYAGGRGINAKDWTGEAGDEEAQRLLCELYMGIRCLDVYLKTILQKYDRYLEQLAYMKAGPRSDTHDAIKADLRLVFFEQAFRPLLPISNFHLSAQGRILQALDFFKPTGIKDYMVDPDFEYQALPANLFFN